MRAMGPARRERLVRSLKALREELELDGVVYRFHPQAAENRPAISSLVRSR
jgi:hypothetical protein